MVKIAVITVCVCGECPYHESDPPVESCEFPNRDWRRLDSEIIADGPIPEWCPLPDRIPPPPVKMSKLLND